MAALSIALFIALLRCTVRISEWSESKNTASVFPSVLDGSRIFKYNRRKVYNVIICYNKSFSVFGHRCLTLQVAVFLVTHLVFCTVTVSVREYV